jgi:hypothetical protein
MKILLGDAGFGFAIRQIKDQQEDPFEGLHQHIDAIRDPLFVKDAIVAMDAVADPVVKGPDRPVQPGQFLFEEFFKGIGDEELTIALYEAAGADTYASGFHQPGGAFGCDRAKKMAVADDALALIVQGGKPMFVCFGKSSYQRIRFLSKQEQDGDEQGQYRETEQQEQWKFLPVR